jgi:hypothetical protein
LSALKNTAPQLHQVGSGRRDECVGGRWFAEDSYYMPYTCTTAQSVVLTFAGEFRDQAPKVAAALDRSTCVDGLAETLGGRLTALTSDDVTLLETTGTSCPVDTQPNYPIGISVRWSPVDPDQEQLDRAASYLGGKCRSEYCEYVALDLEASLAAAADGDRWAAIVEFSDPYWQGKPIDG